MGFLNPKTDFAFLYQTDFEVTCIMARQRNRRIHSAGKFSSVPLTYHDPSDLRSISLLQKKHKFRFWIYESNLGFSQGQLRFSQRIRLVRDNFSGKVRICNTVWVTLPSHLCVSAIIQRVILDCVQTVIKNRSFFVISTCVSTLHYRSGSVVCYGELIAKRRIYSE